MDIARIHTVYMMNPHLAQIGCQPSVHLYTGAITYTYN